MRLVKAADTKEAKPSRRSLTWPAERVLQAGGARTILVDRASTGAHQNGV